jgi:hypothetical protein
VSGHFVVVYISSATSPEEHGVIKNNNIELLRTQGKADFRVFGFFSTTAPFGSASTMWDTASNRNDENHKEEPEDSSAWKSSFDRNTATCDSGIMNQKAIPFSTDFSRTRSKPPDNLGFRMFG